MTVSMMMEIAEEAVIQNSYEAVEKRFREKKCIDISDDLVRAVVDFVGERVVEDNRKMAEQTQLILFPKKTVDKRRRGMVY